MLLVIFYILGIFITFASVIFWYTRNKWSMPLGELILSIILSLGSWFTIGLVLFMGVLIWFSFLVSKFFDWKIWNKKVF